MPARLRMFPALALLLAIWLFGAAAPAQIQTPPGWPQSRVDAGLPWPQGLGRKEAITGHIAGIDKDQIMVKSLDYGDVLFWVDDKTVVRVEKFQLSVKDLRVGDPVAVKLKKIKGRGPYAVEILPHPDVKARKLKGEEPKKQEAEATAHAVAPADSGYSPGLATAQSTAPASAALAASPAEPEFPSLPTGVNGLVGTVASASNDSVEIRDRSDRTQKVLVTGVTLIKRAGTEAVLPSVKPGDRVAVAGDKLDSGEWIAREILVAVAPGSEPAAASASEFEAAPRPARAPGAREVGPDGLARFSGKITSIGNGEIRVQTPRGERVVLVTGITDVQRMGMRRDFGALRQDDQVDVVGDVLEGGVVSAREVTVTKLAGS